MSPALLTVAATLLRKRAAWQLSTTILLGPLFSLAINFGGLRGSLQGSEVTIEGFLLDVGPILAVALFLLATQRKGGQRPGILMLGVPASYLLGFALGVQIGTLLGWVQP